MIISLCWYLIFGTFTVSFMLDNTNTKENFLAAILILALWPLMLGCHVRELINKPNQ